MSRALFAQALRSLVAKVDGFKSYSVVFSDHADGKYYLVRTLEGNSISDVCVYVQLLDTGQRVPVAQLSSLACVLRSDPCAQLPFSLDGWCLFLLPVVINNRDDDHSFVLGRELSERMFLPCFRRAHQELFEMLKVTTTINFLMLRLRGSLQEPWLEDVTVLRRCIIAELVSFADLRNVAAEVILIWVSVRDFVRYTGPRPFRSEVDVVIKFSLHSGFNVFSFPSCFRWGYMLYLDHHCRCIDGVAVASTSYFGFL